ncbi:hypothetical protein [Marispirochaeta aestuarii]|uniref:hypothetical protein n=1 Tax=Marispirochaeta aestuarii TaxID=1963862 RepID=UPI0029C82DC7|nr:hypothetical protein [Marispirochaeta aestuarii]
MKKVITLFAILGLLVPMFGLDFPMPEHQFAQGDWKLLGDRLYQMDEDEPLAKANIRIPQAGPMVYAFNVRYEGGGEDLHGGFGIHVFADSVHPRKSWGSGKSYLLWLNYDADPVSDNIPKGLSAQVYHSVSHTRMDLVKSIDLNKYAYLLNAENLDTEVPVRIVVNGLTGRVRIYSDLYPGYYVYFDIGDGKPMKGEWIALRTNGMAASFGM